MNSSLESDYAARVPPPASIRIVPGTSIELLREVRLKRPPRFALFDFDGTLSLIREGWVDIMLPLMVEVLTATGTRETPDELLALCRKFVFELTGKQTIYQMIRLAEEVRLRGGTPEEPVIYKHRYHDRLMARIEARRESLRLRTAAAETMLVPHSLDLLKLLQDRGVELYLASGTDEHYVREECDLLGLTPYFGRHIYGAQDDVRAFSKQMVIERILRENNVEGDLLVGFGDGYVEIDNIKTAGGTAVGVASDEAGRSGQCDPWKRERLIGVGADIIIPDFRDAGRLVDLFWP
jgi:phosphoglycolate phosphatase-like HAD superfamily hydrolase